MLESNYLSMLLKPNFEKPVDSPQDIIDRNLTVILIPNGGSDFEIMKNSLYPIIKALADLTEISKVICFVYHFSFRKQLIFHVYRSLFDPFWIQVNFNTTLLHR